MSASSFLDGTVDALRNLGHFAATTVSPRLRLGVTGLSRSGKTVFTTALVHHLLGSVAMPVFRASAEGRIRKARLDDQPDDTVPRFPFEEHMASLAEPERRWPESTRRIAELRVSIDYERAAGWRSGPATLALDIVDYPGEWLLDLALLDKSFAEWSRETVTGSRRPERADIAAPWLRALNRDPAGAVGEADIAELAGTFTDYLKALRAGPEAVATTPPGRFLMPGDLAGSPALTFAPLDLPPGFVTPPRSLASQMERRYEAYKAQVVRPFFREHFARLDRQIVLVDVLASLDAGPAALAELETALDQVLLAFRAGRNSFLSSIFSPRIDKVLFAATKADHLHRADHQRLEAILRLLVDRSMRRTQGAGGTVGTVALAAIRATREATVREDGENLAAIVGTPAAGEEIDGQIFDGETEAAIFPGELPDNPETVFSGGFPAGALRFPRFRPPRRARDHGGRLAPLPHIRLDRALEFLLGDRLA
ncbi:MULTISPECIES: YcjX family protein [unclassified Chelatococcus]|uniref:YcjX family protein n=1 Tax=unclassified Chelatococcus TaxID=2638111 RepID=UPI001BCF9067|nr:YcjX family protein [Chelatococcus sp.]MBS7698031.1 YcjX family protein [Chelatococcus sp. YT9]MBX3556651.1 YcjX family protein [Chelatococcus sp.]